MKNIEINNINEEEILYDGKMLEIQKIMQEFKVTYHFYKDIPSYTIEIERLGIIIKGKGEKNPKHNCIKYFGYECGYRDLK